MARMDTPVDPVEGGGWKWSVGGLIYTYGTESQLGLIAGSQDGSTMLISYFKTLDEAVCYSRGYAAGLTGSINAGLAAA